MVAGSGGGPGLRPGPLAFALAALAGSLLGGPLWAQEPGAIVGRVLDASTGAAVAAAEVRVRELRVASNDLGWFVVPDVAAGEHVVEVGRVGYATEARVVMVSGETATLEVRLAPRPIEVAGVEVVGSAARPPYEVARLDLTRESPASGRAVDLLRRVAGAQVFRASGEPGSGPSVRLRGPTSIAVPREPLVIVDGAATSLLALRDMPASDIATVEVLKGAAAAAEYGSRGEAGVIVVTTRRGGPPR